MWLKVNQLLKVEPPPDDYLVKLQKQLASFQKILETGELSIDKVVETEEITIIAQALRDSKIEEPIELTLAIPDDYEIACQMPNKGKTLYAKDYHHLADSPFIASNSLQHSEFKVQNCKFHFWLFWKC